MNMLSQFAAHEIPRFARVRQRLRSGHIADVRADVREKLASALKGKISPGASVAISAGSRGVGGFIELLNGTSDAIRQCGGEPFLIPAMGSHGGATADGQTRLLHTLSVNETTVPAPIRATMETLPLGQSKTGAEAHLDKLAANPDSLPPRSWHPGPPHRRRHFYRAAGSARKEFRTSCRNPMPARGRRTIQPFRESSRALSRAACARLASP